MLSVKPLGKAGDAQGAASYYENLAKDDYYTKGGEPPGQWLGALATEMGLAGTSVKDGQLRAMFEGFHPLTGEQLANNAGPNHKAGWDLAFSAPKPVSTVWAVADQDTRAAIQAAQDRAVRAALTFLEAHAFTSRDRQGNAAINKVLAAGYEHSTSREQDPQLHTHLLVANVGQRVDGSWCALDSDARWKMSAGAVYRAELAAQMQALGFQVARDGDSFAVKGVPAELCDVFSKRRDQIKAALEEKGFTGGKAAEIAALDTRKTKELISRPELFQQWQETALAHGFTAESVNALRQQLEQAEQHAQEEEQEEDPLSRNALFARLTEHDSAFTVHKIYQSVAVAAQGRLTAEQIEERVKELLADGDLVKLRKRAQLEDLKDARNPRANERHFTTREMLELEKTMAERAKALATTPSHEVRREAAEAAMKAYELEKGFALSEEQRNAVLHITAGTGQLAAVRGAAGAGKTTFMEPARAAWESAGFSVRGAALAGKAAAGMQAVGIDSQTVDSLLLQLNGGWEKRLAQLQEFAAAAEEAGRRHPGSAKVQAWLERARRDLAEHKAREITAKTVLLVDEAGMVGSRHMAALLEHSERIGFKVALVGDEKQLQAVSAGGAFQVVQRAAGYVELVENRRQKDAADREAATAVVEGRAADALKSYMDRDRVHLQADQKAAAEEMVRDWTNRDCPLKEKLMMAKMRAEVRLLNALAREQMKANGRLCNEVTISTDTGKQRFAEGDRVLFTQNDARFLKVRNGNLGTVERILFNRKGEVEFVVRLDHDNSLVTWTPEALQGKQKGPYNFLEHGYAVTCHKGQGATVDYAFVLGLGDKEMGYVQVTRHRYEAHVYLSAAEIDKLEEEASSVPATGNMLELMRQLASKLEIEPAAEMDFVSVRLWLDEHAYHLGLNCGDQPLTGEMRRLQAIVKALEVTHQKGTTLDYQAEDELQGGQGGDQGGGQGQGTSATPAAAPAGGQKPQPQASATPPAARPAHDLELAP